MYWKAGTVKVSDKVTFERYEFFSMSWTLAGPNQIVPDFIVRSILATSLEDFLKQYEIEKKV